MQGALLCRDASLCSAVLGAHAAIGGLLVVMAGLLISEPLLILFQPDTEVRAFRIAKLPAVVNIRWRHPAHRTYLNLYGAPISNIDDTKLGRFIFNLVLHSPSAHTSPPCLRWAARAASMRSMISPVGSLEALGK